MCVQLISLEANAVSSFFSATQACPPLFFPGPKAGLMFLSSIILVFEPLVLSSIASDVCLRMYSTTAVRSSSKPKR